MQQSSWSKCNAQTISREQESDHLKGNNKSIKKILCIKIFTHLVTAKQAKEKKKKRLVYLGFYVKLPWTGELINSRNLRFTVLETEKSKIKTSLVSGESCFLAYRWCLLTMSPDGGKGLSLASLIAMPIFVVSFLLFVARFLQHKT